MKPSPPLLRHCPWCQARPGEPCINTISGEPVREGLTHSCR